MKSNRTYTTATTSAHNAFRPLTDEEIRAVGKEDRRLERMDAAKMVDSAGVDLYKTVNRVAKFYSRRLFNEIQFEVAFSKAILPLTDEAMEEVVLKKAEVKEMFKARLADPMNFTSALVTTKGYATSSTWEFCNAFAV